MSYRQLDNSEEEQSGENSPEKPAGDDEKTRGRKFMILLIVFVTVLLDNMLSTVIVPIVPNFLWQISASRTNFTSECVSLAKNASISAAHSRMFNGSSSTLVNWVIDVMKQGSGVPGDGHIGRSPFLPPDAVFAGPLASLSLNSSRSQLIQCIEKAQTWRQKQLQSLNLEVGILFASKYVVQIIVNPFVGKLTNRIGFSIPMFSGFVIMFASTILFAFGHSFPVLLVARCIQGVGASFSSVSGLGQLATEYTDDEVRGRMMSVALSGIAVGVIAGPPFGGFMYEFVSRESAFLSLSALALLNGILQLLFLRPRVSPSPREDSPLKSLLTDPYILFAASCLIVGNSSIACLESILPIWMRQTMGTPKWQQGCVFLPASFAYLAATNLFGTLSFRIGRWLCSALGLVLIAISLFATTFAHSFWLLLSPIFCIGFGTGMNTSSILPSLAHLVDIRHVSVYGGVYAIADTAMCLGLAFGPSLGGLLVGLLGFSWSLRLAAIFLFCFAPLLLLLRNPPGRAENDESQQNLSQSLKHQPQYQTAIDSTTPPKSDRASDADSSH